MCMLEGEEGVYTRIHLYPKYICGSDGVTSVHVQG